PAFPNVSSPSPLSSLSLHDALPIYRRGVFRFDLLRCVPSAYGVAPELPEEMLAGSNYLLVIILIQKQNVFFLFFLQPGDPFLNGDRKSTRLNSSHVSISYAVFCLKK